MQSKHIKPVLIIFITAITVRIIFCLFVYHPLANTYFPNWNHPPGVFGWQSDDKYDDIARNLVAGLGYKIRGGTDNKLYPNLIRPPVYPYILAAQFYLFGDGYWINMLINVLYQSLAGIVLYYLTLMMFNERKIAIVSSLVWAIYPLPMLNAMGPLTESVYALFLVVFAYFFYKYYKVKKTKYLVYASVFLVILTLTRPISLMFPVYFIAVTLIMREYPIKVKIKQIAIVVLILIAGIAPWMYRGYSITGEFIPLVTYKRPINYYVVDKVYDKGFQKGHAKIFLDEIKNPLVFVKNMVVRLTRYWYYGHTTVTRIVNAILQFTLLMISVLGIWKARQKRQLIFPVLLIILFFWLAYSATHALSKYSFPIVILLSPFTAIGILRLLNQIDLKTKFNLQPNTEI